jgi:hypothetical protein
MPTRIAPPAHRTRFAQPAAPAPAPTPVLVPAPAPSALINDAVIGPHSAWSSARTLAEIEAAQGGDMPDVTLIFDNRLV